MGLDAHCFQNIKRVENEYEEDFTPYVIDDNWKYKIKNLEENKPYKGDYVSFHIQYSYGTHNRFRETLLKLIGKEDLLNNDGRINWSLYNNGSYSKTPFYEFIDFADNEGSIDWETNERIYNSFKEYEEKAKEFYKDDNYFLGKYMEWLDVFKHGKNKGVVVFR